MQAHDAAVSLVASQLAARKAELLRELESSVLGGWGEQLRGATAADTAATLAAAGKVCAVYDAGVLWFAGGHMGRTC
jgi:hypothetical protein